jgi:hypothetical protein
MPALVRIAGQHRPSLEALVHIAGYQRVQPAIAETREDAPPVIIPQTDQSEQFDRLMRQRAEGPLGSAV